MENIKEKLQNFAILLEKEQIENLRRKNLACQANIDNCRVIIKEGKKYFKVDLKGSGKYYLSDRRSC